ncbi:MAG: camphor resistance protein CrcB [Acetobacteraceae bacterium SCN 69-10]|nr:MAG: camphor resistance protein CrcB [Acetobacteraceae bacterium SCN 69-10]
MDYAWVAIGSSLGGMGRSWVATAMARLTGPQFPWGTILINIVGSFVIGLVAAATAPGGRFAAPQELRLFVMVGVCGGFTTFSSFSLQTLELLRDGRPGEALGNIVLSVGLCVAGVAVGYYGGTALHAARALGQQG